MIKLLQEGMLLYHGSYCEVSEPDISKCSPFKDFGRGFYLTTECSQAEQFAKLSSRKAFENGLIPASQNFGVVSVFKFHSSGQTEIMVYPEADKNGSTASSLIERREFSKMSDTIRQNTIL